MTLFLDGATRKIERAEEDIQNLAALIGDYRSRHTYKGALDFDPQGRQYFKGFIFEDTPPLRWAVISGEAIHHLRSALDHVACQLALAKGRTNCDGWNIQFPVFDKCGKEDKARYERIVKNFPDAAKAIINGLQPYNRPTTQDQAALFMLNEMDIRDKHQLLNLMFTILTKPTLVIQRPHHNIEVVQPDMISRQVTEASAIVFTISVPDGGPEVYVHGEFPPEIVFDELGPGKGEPVIPLLQQLVDFTRRTVGLFR